MKSTSISEVTHNPEGLYISTKVKDLPPGEYAFVEGEKGTDVLKRTKSHGTDFYKFICSINISYGFIKSSELFPKYPVELNACPTCSDTMDYAQDALVFNI